MYPLAILVCRCLTGHSSSFLAFHPQCCSTPSLHGQAEHWPLHKKLCRAQRTEQAEAAEEGGGDAIPSARAWERWQGEARWLNPLVFKLLGERNCKDHAVVMMVEFHAERSPQFEAVNWKVVTLEELRQSSPKSAECIVDKALSTGANHAGQLANGEFMAFAVVACVNGTSTAAKMVPVRLTPEMREQILDPEISVKDLVDALNVNASLPGR